MEQVYRQKSLEYWDNVHKDYDRATIKVDDWLEKFDDIIMGTQKPILDLGCGGGNDTLYLIWIFEDQQHLVLAFSCLLCYTPVCG